jgi:hypothetical protein
MFPVLNTFVVTSFENSGYGISKGISHLSSGCVHFPTASQNDSEVFELIDKL